LVIDVLWQTTHASGTIALSDSAGNTYVQIFQREYTTSGLYAESWIAVDGNGGANTVTATYTGSGSITHISMAIHEYANVVAASPVDDYDSSPWDATITRSVTQTITRTMSNEILHAWGCVNVGVIAVFITPPAGFDVRENFVYTDTLITCDLQITLPAGSSSTTFSYEFSSALYTPPLTGALIALKCVSTPTATTEYLIIQDPEIGYTDRSAYLNFDDAASFDVSLRERGNANFTLYVAAADSYAPTLGTQCFLYDRNSSGTSTVFGGTIDDVKITWIGSKGDRMYHLTAVSFEQCFDVLLVPPQTFFYQTAATIFTSLLASVAGGVPVVVGNVSGATAVINVLQTNWDRLSDVFNNLATAAGCIWGVDLATMTIYLKAPATTAAPFTLASSQVLWDSNEWLQERKDYRNRQIIRISPSAFAQSAELFPGDGYTQSFSLIRPAQEVTFAWTTKNTQNSANGDFNANPTSGDTVTIAYPDTGSIFNWAENAPYSVGQVIVDPANHIQVVTLGGTSGGSAPPWNNTGGATGPDGSLYWQDQGLSGAGGIGAAVYTFVNTLDNTAWGDVLIGVNALETAQNLVDAINSTQSVAGQSFSWPTWENPLVNASRSGSTVNIKNKNAGQDYKANLSESSGATRFYWDVASTTGGITTFGTASLQVAAEGSSNTANLYYTPGSSIVTVVNAPASGTFLQVQYTRAASNCIVVEDTAQVISRAIIENGTGKYQQITDDSSNTSNTNGLQAAQATLAAYSVLPISFSFHTLVKGLTPGMLLAISVTKPTGLGTLINGSYVINTISAELLTKQPYMDSSIPGGGRYRYTVTVINQQQVSSWQDFWKDMSSGGGGGGGGNITAGLIPGGTSTTGISGIEVMVPVAGHITPTIGVNFTHEITLVANEILDAPTGPTSGAIFCVKLNQDATGGRVVTFNAFYTGMSGFSLDTTASTYASLTFQINAAGTSAALINIPINGSPIA
tara:strand:+ start:5457 stop:8369 length:2913 start_codon:yes stop_codon:yes gene_type:complete